MRLKHVRDLDQKILYRLEPRDFRGQIVAMVRAGKSLARADLAGVNLLKADLTGADLAGASLLHANLKRTNLAGADLSGADLQGFDFRNADLRGANLSGATLNPTGNITFKGARLDGATMPNGESLEDFIATTVPALLASGGRPLPGVLAAWGPRPRHSGRWPLCEAIGWTCDFADRHDGDREHPSRLFLLLLNEGHIPRPKLAG